MPVGEQNLPIEPPVIRFGLVFKGKNCATCPLPPFVVAQKERPAEGRPRVLFRAEPYDGQKPATYCDLWAIAARIH